jgi:hypothetical protein
MATSVDETQVNATIEKLIAEEHELWGRQEARRRERIGPQSP